MYGLVNKALEELVVNNHGPEVWVQVKQLANVGDDVFISDESYDDLITYKLVGTISDVTQIPVTDILFKFGEHWVLKTGPEYYGALLKSGGANLKEFLQNLPHFHSRIQLIYPKLRPPEFECTDITDNSIKLHYKTHRSGLTSFVFGLLNGLSTTYQTPIEVSLISSKELGDPHDIFHIRWA